MKTLHLTLKKKWFDMILSGEKKEEYREIKRHWIAQLITNNFTTSNYKDNGVIDLILGHAEHYSKNRIAKFDTITFTNGYSSDAPEMVVECKGIKIKEGDTEWGAEPGTKYFVITLGEILSTKNIKK